MPVSARTTPGDFHRASITVTNLISFAYRTSPTQLSGGPAWMRTERYEVNARTGGTASLEQMRVMVQSLLEDRFKIVVREESREVSYQALRVRNNDGRLGAGLEKCDPLNRVVPTSVTIPAGAYPAPLSGGCVPITELVNVVSIRLNAIVIDETGLDGFWNYLVWHASQAANAASELPSLPVALEEELGLKLVSARGPQKLLVIESIHRPAEN